MPSKPIIVNASILADDNTLVEWIVANDGGINIKRGFLEWSSDFSSESTQRRVRREADRPSPRSNKLFDFNRSLYAL